MTYFIQTQTVTLRTLDSEKGETQHDKTITLVRNEVQLYFTGTKKEDPLKWWRENGKLFPTLAKLAKSVLCIPATFIPAEQIFCSREYLLSEES